MTTAEDDTEPGTVCDEDAFAELVAEMVSDEAPRLFAVVQERGEREAGWVAAWGMAFDDRATVVSSGGGSWLSLCSPERACRAFDRDPDITVRLVWVTSPTPE